MIATIFYALLTLVGIFAFPHLTLCIALWLLGHPILGIIALIRGIALTE